MMAQAIKCLASVSRDPKKMVTSQNELSTRKNPATIPTFVSGTATPTSSAPRKTVG